MTNDEQQIRQLVADWFAATKAGNIDAVLDLMTEDVVFLIPGRPPMNKAEFAANSRPQPGTPRPEFEGRSNIREIQIAGEWAFMWTELSVTVKPPGGSPIERAGNTLTILRKTDGKWRLARDANLLAPKPGPAK